MTPPPVLTGLIKYRLDLSDASSDWSSTKNKKRRRLESANGAANHDSLRRAGFTLLDTAQQEYLLVIPQSLLKMVCDAARFKVTVRITSYSVSSVAPSNLSVLNLFTGGLDIQQINDTKVHSSNDRALSLSQFRILEKSFSKSNNSKKPSTFSITAAVDSISPLIAAVPSDPFCLMELYEPHDDADADTDILNTCVVVIKGAMALGCHAGIQPGDSITLRNVKRQKWHVPEWFTKSKCGLGRLASRAPTYLFVVTDPFSIDWESSIVSLGGLSAIPSMPSTAVPLVAIQGRIESVDVRQEANESRVMYSVKLCQKDNGVVTDVLFVSHYPMSPELLLGIQPGAILRAVNVHNLKFRNAEGQCNYAACLRSTLTLLCTANERLKSGVTDDSGGKTMSMMNREQLFRESANQVVPGQLPRPFVFGEARAHYRHEEFRKYLEECRIAEKLCAQDGLRDQLPSLNEIQIIVVQHCTRTQSPIQLQSSNKQKRKRDPYAEFFDHACDDEQSGRSANGPRQDLTGCPLSREVDELIFPTFVDLKDIHYGCINHLKERLELLLSPDDHKRKRMSHSSVQGGWTGSFSLASNDLIWKKCCESSGLDSSEQQVADEYQNQGMDHYVVTCCTVSSMDQDDRPTSLADSEYQLPASFVDSSLPTVSATTAFIVDVHAAVVSCLCLGRSNVPLPKQTTNGVRATGFSSVDLPLYEPEIRSAPGKKGSCVLIEHSGFLFIVTIQVQCGFLSALRRRGAELKKKNGAVDLFERTIKAQHIHSIRECLCRDKKIFEDGNQSFTGLLVRQRFRFVKIRNGSFLGCVLTLSHLPRSYQLGPDSDSSVLASRLSTLQSIELKISVSFPNGQLGILQKSMRKLLGDNAGGILQEQSDLAAAWWRISDSGLASCLVSNGLDDYVSSPPMDMADAAHVKTPSVVSHPFLVPVVVVPCSTIREGGHGYLRFQCSLNDIRASFLQVSNDSRLQNLPLSPETMRLFDAVGGLKFLIGSLDRRPRRRQLYNQGAPYNRPSRRVITGELLAVPSDVDSGVFACTLAELHWKICADMRNHTQSELAPSMVRVIRNATLLSLSFCRAMAECTKCFQPLKQQKSNRSEKDRPVSGVVSSVQVDDKKETTTYWHLPFPMVGNTNSNHGSNRTSHQTSRRQEALPHTTLACPNGCSIEHARIKWECSGLLDDGSGQAKLYSEREVALMLLGANLRVEDIEAGAWRIEGGVLFQKTIPPKSYVKQAVVQAQSLAQQEMNRIADRTKRRKLVDADVIKFLTVEARAEYYMQQHCRQSMEPLRRLDYYVRCKPLSKEAIHLNQTHVEMAVPPVKDYMQASTMDVTTYTLPPLKLSLVDCSVPKYDAETNTSASWDLVRAMTNSNINNA